MRMSDVINSSQLRCIYVCPSNIGHAVGSAECTHWVSAALYFAFRYLTWQNRAVLASFLLNEELGHLGRLGCTLCLIGSLVIVLHAPEDKVVETVDEILDYALRPGAWCRRASS